MLGLRERDDYLTQIVFVRHGESCGNVGLPFPDSFHPDDPPLTPNGLWQAQQLSTCFEKGELDCIFSSPLTRAVQTAYPTAQKLGMEIVLMPDLMEVGTQIGGCSHGMLASDFPLAVPCTAEPTLTGGSLLLPEKEDSVMLAQRAGRCVDYIRNNFNAAQRVLVVSHGTFFGYLVREALNVEGEESFNWEVDNCAVTCVAIRKDARLPLLRTANNTMHLK